MKSLLRLTPVLACLLVLSSSHAQMPAPKITKIEIRHIGPQTVNDDLIRDNIRVKQGDAYLQATVDEDIRNLYGTGFFYNVRIITTPDEDGVSLTYQVQAKPRLTDIKFSGNAKFSDSKLQKKVTSKIGDPLDEQKFFKDTLEIVKHYEKSGLHGTQVKYVLSVDENAGRGAVTFEIKEAPKVRVVDVVFDNAKAFPQKELRKVCKTRRWWIFSWLTGSGKLKEDEFEQDRDRLEEHYRDKGYLDFNIKDVRFDYLKTNRMAIHFVVDEGPQYKVGAISFKGTTMLPTNVCAADYKMPEKKAANADARTFREMMMLNSSFAMKEGGVYTPKGLGTNTTAIEDFYGTRGYIDVGANLQVRKIPNIEKQTIDLQFNVEEGKKSYIEKIEIRGNNKTKDRVIRRELAVAPGETFDMVKVKLSKRRLEGLQYFEKIETRPEATDVPDRKNLVIDVEEKSTGNFTVGAGFSSVDSLVGYIDVSQGNFDIANPPSFTGGGQKARVHLALGTRRRDIVVTFIEPWFLDRKLSLGIDAYHRWLDYVSLNDLYNETRTGAKLSLTKALGSDFLIGSVYYNLESIGIEDVEWYAPPDILAQEGTSLLSRIGGTLAYDTRNNSLMPDRGQRTELFAELTGAGGDQSFYKVELRTSWYFKGFAKGHIIELIGRVGSGDVFGNTASIPFYDRYYLGGQYTMRGFKYRDIGPKQREAGIEDTWEPVGGCSYWMASLEYSIPVIERVRLAAFYDIGMAYSNPFSFGGTGNTATTSDPGGYADNWGLGVRLNLPIGPLRLDYGIPINTPLHASGSGQFQFGVGYTRDF